MAPIVVIGGSQGGVEAVLEIASGLPAEFPAAVLVVLHVGAGPSTLPSILNGVGLLPASHGKSGDRIEAGHIYVAPADHHLIVADGHLKLSKGPRENWTRPAIDPLFRTAAAALGPDCIGVILTGGLNDGTAGLYRIKQCGGVAVVQDPKDADAPSMPRSALENVDIDFCVPVAEIAPLLVRLVKDVRKRERGKVGVPAMEHSDQETARPVAQTCPECGGAMREENVGTLTQFRCHIGHVMTAEVLVAAQLEDLEQHLGSVLRLLNERADLCRELAEKQMARGNTAARDFWMRASREAKERETAIRAMTEAEWIRPETVEQAAE